MLFLLEIKSVAYSGKTSFPQGPVWGLADLSLAWSHSSPALPALSSLRKAAVSSR